jgi:hypothetical protein
MRTPSRALVALGLHVLEKKSWRFADGLPTTGAPLVGFDQLAARSRPTECEKRPDLTPRPPSFRCRDGPVNSMVHRYRLSVP